MMDSKDLYVIKAGDYLYFTPQTLWRFRRSFDFYETPSGRTGKGKVWHVNRYDEKEAQKRGLPGIAEAKMLVDEHGTAGMPAPVITERSKDLWPRGTDSLFTTLVAAREWVEEEGDLTSTSLDRHLRVILGGVLP